MMAGRMIKKKPQKNPCLIAVKLRRIIAVLATVSIQAIQNCCLRDVQHPCQKKQANRPLLTK
jgi:hypothetical protein